MRQNQKVDTNNKRSERNKENDPEAAKSKRRKQTQKIREKNK